MSSNEWALRRLRSARGHLDAAIRMTEDQRCCIDLLRGNRPGHGALAPRSGAGPWAQRTVAVDAGCVLTETSAVTQGLHEVIPGLVDDRIRRCVRQVATREADAAEMVTEATRAVAPLIRS